MAKASKNGTTATNQDTRQRYIEWLATPKADRFEPTQEMFAHVHSVSTRTLQRWQNEPGFWTEVHDLAFSGFGVHLSEIYASIARNAKRGSLPHIKLALQLMGILGANGGVSSSLKLPADPGVVNFSLGD